MRHEASGWIAGLEVTDSVLPGEIPCFRVGAGPPLVMFVGLGPTNGPAKPWQRRVEIRHLRPLARHFTIHALNRRPGLPSGVTMADIASDYAVAIRSAFATPIDLIGPSTGGNAALQFALDYPALVRRLVIIAAGSRLSDASRTTLERACQLFEQSRPRAGQQAIAAAIFAPGPVCAFMGAMMWLSAGVVGLTRNWDCRDMVHTMRADNAFDVTERLSEIRIPTLVINGSDDPTVPRAMSQLLVSKIATARLIEYKGGHATVLSNQRLWHDVTAFLEEGVA